MPWFVGNLHLLKYLVWTVSTLEGLHNSSKLIHFMRQHLLVETSSATQEAQSLSNSVWDWVIAIATIEPQAFLDVNMDKVTTDMRNEPSKRSPRIKLMIFCWNTKGSDLDIRINPGVAYSFKFFLRLPQHYWELVSDDIHILSSPAKVLHFPVSSIKYSNNAAPHTHDIQKINFGKETDGSKSDKVRQPNGKVLAQTTNHSESAAFASPLSYASVSTIHHLYR